VKRAAAVLAAAALVLGSAACGGGGSGRLSKNQYEAKMQSLDRGLASTERNLTIPGPADVTAAAATFGALADAFEAFDTQLGRFRSPRDIQSLQDRLAGGAGQAAKELRAMASKLSGASSQRIQLLLRQFDESKLQAALREIELAAAAIRAKGYRIGASAGT
jgi:hypothetical protein